MNILRLSISNFLTIGKADIELDNRGLLLIQGVNKDDPSAESNGSGKSSIVDALCWALYGVTARGVASDAVVNKLAKKDCHVSVSLQEKPGADGYLITRYRKDAVKKNQVVVEQIPASGAPIDLSKGTDRETQEVINGIMGCSLEVFMAAVYAGQEMMPDLPAMTDKTLKTLIEEAAGVEVLTKAYTIARNRCQNETSGLEAFLKAQSEQRARLSSIDGELSTMVVSESDFDLARKERAKTELAKAVPVKAEIARLTEMLDKSSPTAPLQEEMKALGEKLHAEKLEKAGLAELKAIEVAAEKNVSRLRARVEMAVESIKKADKAILEVDSQVGKPCGECGKPYHGEDLATAKDLRVKQAASVREEAAAFSKEYKAALEALKTASDITTRYEASMTDFSAVAARQYDLSEEISVLNRIKSSIAAKNVEVESIMLLGKAKLTEPNPWTKAVESKKDDRQKCYDSITHLITKVHESTKKVEILNDAVQVFGPAGVRALILDTVTPYLNDRTRAYLGALADGNIHAEWNTLSRTAKGEVREKFNIDVVNDKGAESFAGLSGGEKRKVRLSTAMALQDMVASRATKPINIFIADEVDHALDENGLERLMDVLERKARERGTVLVISHNSLADWCDNVINVTKEGGVATVSGAIKHGK